MKNIKVGDKVMHSNCMAKVLSMSSRRGDQIIVIEYDKNLVIEGVNINECQEIPQNIVCWGDDGSFPTTLKEWAASIKKLSDEYGEDNKFIISFDPRHEELFAEIKFND